MRLLADVIPKTEVDLVVRYVDKLPAQRVPRYLTADIRCGWRLLENVELALSRRHLLKSPHAEFAPQIVATVPGQVEADIHTTLS